MRTLLKMLGVLLFAFGLRSLFDSDWLAFAMLCALGGGLLIDLKSGGAANGLRWTLLLVAFVLAFVRLASFLSG